MNAKPKPITCLTEWLERHSSAFNIADNDESCFMYGWEAACDCLLSRLEASRMGPEAFEEAAAILREVRK